MSSVAIFVVSLIAPALVPWLGVLVRRPSIVWALAAFAGLATAGWVWGIRQAEVAYCRGDEDCMGEVLGFWTVILLPWSALVILAIVVSSALAAKRAA